MAYTEKYRFNIEDNDLGSGQISIQQQNYSGYTKELTLERDGLDFKYHFKGWENRIIGSSLDLKIVNNFDNFYELDELMFVYANQFRVIFTLDNHPEWGPMTVFDGFIEPQTTQQDYRKQPTIHLQCSTYLNKLKGVTPPIATSQSIPTGGEMPAGLDPFPEYGYVNYIDALHILLFQTGKELPIYVNSYLQSEQSDASTDLLTPFKDNWIETQLLKDNSKEFKHCFDILTYMLESYDNYLYYWNDAWYIENYNSLAGNPDNIGEKEYVKWPFASRDETPATIADPSIYLSENNFINNTIEYQKGIKKYRVKLDGRFWTNFFIERYDNMELISGYNPDNGIVHPKFRKWYYNDSSVNIEPTKFFDSDGEYIYGFRINDEYFGGDESTAFDQITASSSMRTTVSPKDSENETKLNISFTLNAWDNRDIPGYLEDDGTEYILEYSGMNIEPPFNLGFWIYIEEIDTTYWASDLLDYSLSEGKYNLNRKFDPPLDVELELNLSQKIDNDSSLNTNITVGFQPARYEFKTSTSDPDYAKEYIIRPIQYTQYSDLKAEINGEVENNVLEAIIDNKAKEKEETELTIFSTNSFNYMNTPFYDEGLNLMNNFRYDQSSTYEDLQKLFLDGRVQLYHKERRNFKAKMFDYQKIIKPFTKIEDDYLSTINPYSSSHYLIVGYKHNLENGQRDLDIRDWETFNFQK